jgi:hypothetical protein
MLKIKVIKEISQSYYGSISSLIGNIYDVKEILEDRVMIYVPEWKGMCSVFEGEYEKINA